MRFDIVTIFPEFFAGPLEHGIVRRAREAGLVEVRVEDLRKYTHDRHRTVDDRPFGGGEGMVLKPEPLFEAVESLVPRWAHRDDEDNSPGEMGEFSSTAVVLLSASGKLFRQETARRFAGFKHLVLLCGRYEGVDERVAEHLATDEISIGDYVLSGGELPAAIVVDAVTRLIPGALGNEASVLAESFSDLKEGFLAPLGMTDRGATSSSTSHESPITSHLLLDCPHYTRPPEFRGWRVPEVLIGGNHEEIRRWRRQAALEKTQRNRPDLLE
jgi:tRNA (guanine37-N1)-methyltransferase